MAEDIYKRYADLERQANATKQTRRDPTAAAGGVLAALVSKTRGIKGIDSGSKLLTGQLFAAAKARHEMQKLKPQIDAQNYRLATANSQIASNAALANQRAAIEGQVQDTRSAAGTADLASGQDGDTETPGGTSGRRRRTSAAVGSIRI